MAKKARKFQSRLMFVSALTFALLFASPVFQAFAATNAAAVDTLRQKITENNQKIEEIQKQIDEYSTLLNTTSKQAQTLKNAVSTLEVTQKKLEANLKLTSTQISKTSLTLDELESDIQDTEKKISSTSVTVATNLRQMNMAEAETAIEELLKNKSMSETWDYLNALRSVGGRVKLALADLRDLRQLLGAKRDAAQGEKSKLESYKKSLSEQTVVVQANKQEKDKLLQVTKNKESEYKSLLDQKMKEREAFEKQLFEYESQLKVAIDPTSIPDAKLGILSWPLASVSVTQYFGKTVAAKRLYTSGTHGGIDLRASVGTKVTAALTGTVIDTEAVRTKSGCQYGKWVLIRHPNGLTSIYGHLSLVSVSPGDTVLTGETIGYSGDTGYATGPHLHFGVYASAGVKIVDSSSLGSGRCSGIKTVAAPTTAYLDPSAYLPKI
jgi:murein DD-endopeptidase MepM/ murein hydrolase activator NlpD